jgi:GNAT superfamily N-acetyltransferase
MPEFLAQPPRPLQPGDPVAAFDCGVEELNRYLRCFALANQRANAAVTYAAMRQGTIAGYYTVVAASAEYGGAPERMKKGLARHPIPVLLLARLAVDVQFRGQGLGAQLVRDAALLTVKLSKLAGIRALIVDAKDERARQFYERLNFEVFPTNPLRLFVLTKDLLSLTG